ncbi:unnamed protein product [Amaranthus hypochondriacus]
MGKFLGKCKEIVGEIAFVGVKTRARARAALMAATSTPSPTKKIKKVSKSNILQYQLRNRRRTTSFSSQVVVEEDEKIVNCESSREVIITNTSSDFPPPCCSSNNVDGVNEDEVNINLSKSSESEVVKDCLEISITDPEVQSTEEASSRYIDCHRTEEAREITKSDGQQSSSTQSTVQNKMPSHSEIEDFFASAEKEIQKRFIDKYNFDFENDAPLEGRYEWVPIKP